MSALYKDDSLTQESADAHRNSAFLRWMVPERPFALIFKFEIR